MAFLEVKDVTKIYRMGEEDFPALRNVSLTVEEGDFLALTGPSGSGKSTLLTVMGAMNPPTQGEVFIDGISVYRLPVEKQADLRSEYLGFVFQQFCLLPYLTALENVMVPLTIKPYPAKTKKEMAYAALEKVGLANKAGRLPGQLSGGEQERVAIARAIVNDAPLLFADEPTGSLDSRTGREIMELFARLNEEGKTIVLVTHNLEFLSYVKRVVSIRDGTLVAVGSAKGEMAP